MVMEMPRDLASGACPSTHGPAVGYDGRSQTGDLVGGETALTMKLRLILAVQLLLAVR